MPAYPTLASLRGAERRARSVRYQFTRKDLPTASGSESTCTPKFRVDPTIQILIGHGLAGAIVGWGVLIGLVATDAVGLGSLLAQADLGRLALAVLTLQFGVGFATFAIVTALAFPLGTAWRPWSAKRPWAATVLKRRD